MQFDGSKWSLSGFDGRPVVTIESTTVWINATDGVKVPARMVLGNEVTGVEQSTIHLCDACVEIPQLGMKHSLNIATAAGVVLWELVRRRLKSEGRERSV